MAPRNIHQRDAMSLHQVISPLSPRFPRVLPTSYLGEDIADDLGRRRLFQVPGPGLDQAAREDRVSAERWRGSLSSVSSNYSRQTRAASARLPKKRFGRLFSLFKKKGLQRADIASLNSRHSNKKVSTTMRRAIGKFVGKVHRRRRDGSMAEHHNASVPEDVGGLLGDFQLPDLVQNRINNGNVTQMPEQSPDKHASIIAAVETILSKDIGAKGKDAAILPAMLNPTDRTAKKYAKVPATPKPTEKNAKFEELSQVRSSKSGNEGYAALRGEKYNSKGPLYDDLAFADAKSEDSSEDVRRSGYNSPDLEHNEREFSNTYSYVPAAQNLAAADRKPRTKSEMAAQTGYVLINKQLVDPDSLHETNRAERGLPAEHWEGSKIIAQMPDSPTDNNNKNLITDHRDNDDKDDVSGHPKEDGSSIDDNGGPAAGNFDESTTGASLSQEDMVKSRVAAWERLTGKKAEPGAEPATKKSLGDSITTSSSNNSPDHPLVSGRMIIEMAKDLKRVETRSTALVEVQTHKEVFEHTREGPKPPGNREHIQDANHRGRLNKSPGGGSKLSDYSVETHPSSKDTNEGHDLTRVPQFINKNMGAPLMAPGQSSGIVYDRGRRSNSVRKMKRSESLRSQSAVSERIVMPNLESKSTAVHTGGTLQTLAVNDPTALVTARLEKTVENAPTELPAIAGFTGPVTDPAVLEVDLSQEQIFRLIEKVPTEQLMHIFHEKLLKESDERELAMEAQATAALNEATGPIHGLAYDYDQACLNRVAVAELREFRKTLHYTLNGWRTEQVMMAAHWDANYASHEADRKYVHDRLNEAKDKLIEVTRRINTSDAQYTTMVQNMNKVRRQMMENVRRRMGREDFQAFERSLGSPALSVNSSNGGFSPAAPQPDTPYQHVTQHNRHAFNYKASPSQSRPSPGVSPIGHQHGPRLQQVHSSPYIQHLTGRQPPIFSSPSYNNNNKGAGLPRRRDPTPQRRQETPRHRPSYAQPNHVPVLSIVPELTPEVAAVIQQVNAIVPPTPTPTRQRNSSAPAGPQLEQQQQYRRVVSDVVAGATRTYRQPPPPAPMMTPERVRELVQPRSAPQNYRGVDFGGSPPPQMLPPARPATSAAAAGARKSAMSFVTALGEEVAVVAAEALFPLTPVLRAEHVGDTEDLVLPPLPPPVRTDEEMEEEWQREQREKNQQREQHRTPMMAREDSEHAVWYTARQYRTREQQWRAEQERERLAAELGGIVVGERSLDHLRMGFGATRRGVETDEERELREAEEEIRRMEAKEAEKSVLAEEDE